MPIQNHFDTFSGQFRDNSLEKLFCKHIFKKHEFLLRKTLFTSILIYMAFGLADYLTFANSSKLPDLLYLRLAAVGGALAILVYAAFKGTLSQSRFMVNVALIFLIIGYCQLLALHTEFAEYQFGLILITIFASHLYLHSQMPNLVILSALLSVGYLMAISAEISSSPYKLPATTLSLLTLNSMGFLIIKNIKIAQRQYFFSLLTERNNIAQLKQEIIRMGKHEKKLLELAHLDELTRVNNRRRFIELANHELEQAGNTGEPITVCILDIDFFKNINDTYGHLAGDKVIETVALLCKSQLRKNDIIGRFGGEEFVMILPNTSINEARHVAERIRLTIGQHIFNLNHSNLNLTVTIGVSLILHKSMTIEEALHRADMAMYSGKRSGRNQVTIAA